MPLTHHPLQHHGHAQEPLGFQPPPNSNPEHWVPSREAVGTSFTAFGLTQLGMEPTTSRSQGDTLPLDQTPPKIVWSWSADEDHVIGEVRLLGLTKKAAGGWRSGGRSLDRRCGRL